MQALLRSFLVTSDNKQGEVVRVENVLSICALSLSTHRLAMTSMAGHRISCKMLVHTIFHVVSSIQHTDVQSLHRIITSKGFANAQRHITHCHVQVRASSMSPITSPRHSVSYARLPALEASTGNTSGVLVARASVVNCKAS